MSRDPLHSILAEVKACSSKLRRIEIKLKEEIKARGEPLPKRQRRECKQCWELAGKQYAEVRRRPGTSEKSFQQIHEILLEEKAQIPPTWRSFANFVNCFWRTKSQS